MLNQDEIRGLLAVYKAIGSQFEELKDLDMNESSLLAYIEAKMDAFGSPIASFCGCLITSEGVEDLSYAGNVVDAIIVDGKLPPKVGLFHNLESVEIIDQPNLIVNLRYFTGLNKLTKIQVIRGHLEDGLPKNLGQIKSLSQLILAGSVAGGSIPESIGELKELKELTLNDLGLEHGIPESIGQCEQLEEIKMTGNPLGGKIPESISQLKHLKYFEAMGAGLVGEIPESLCQISYLEALNLSYNNLEGDLPYCLFFINGIEYIDLISNRLSGSLPPHLKKSKKLPSIYLDNNKISKIHELTFEGIDPNEMNFRIQKNQIKELPENAKGFLKVVYVGNPVFDELE